MMRKLLIFVLLFSACSGAKRVDGQRKNAPTATASIDKFIALERDMSAKRDVLYTVNQYRYIYNYDGEKEPNTWAKELNYCKTAHDHNFLSEAKRVECEKIRASHERYTKDENFCSYRHSPSAQIYSLFARPQVNMQCMVASPTSSVYNSDECILARRNAIKTNVCYFNYEKYLPESVKIKNDMDFMHLVNLSIVAEPKKRACLANMNLTSAEREQCAGAIDNFIRQVANNTAINCKDKLKDTYKKMVSAGGLMWCEVNLNKVYSQVEQDKQCREYKNNRDEIAQCVKIKDTPYSGIRLSDNYEIIRSEVHDFEINNSCTLNTLNDDRLAYVLSKSAASCKRPYKDPTPIGIPVYITNPGW